jgi:hypothetical protein
MAIAYLLFLVLAYLLTGTHGSIIPLTTSSIPEVDYTQCVAYTFSFLDALNDQLNDPTTLGQLVSDLNLPAHLARYGAQVIFNTYYTKHHATLSLMTDAAYGQCTAQFDTLINNFLVRSGLISFSSEQKIAEECQAATSAGVQVTLKWKDNNEEGTTMNVHYKGRTHKVKYLISFCSMNIHS